MNFPKKQVRIIEVNNLEFTGKDIVEVKKEDDFKYLLLDDKIVYKLGNKYYIISESVAFVYEEK